MGGVTAVKTDDKSDEVRHDIVVYHFQFPNFLLGVDSIQALGPPLELSES